MSDIDVIDTVPAMAQTTKTVEGRLMETLKKLAATEGNLYLFNTLKGMGLSTNNVTNFVLKQSTCKLSLTCYSCAPAVHLSLAIFLFSNPSLNLKIISC